MKTLPFLAFCALAAFAGCSRKSGPAAPTFTFTAIEYPGSRETEPSGISGDMIFGNYIDNTGTLRAFLYDIPSKKFSTLEEPGVLLFPIPTGVSDNTLAGYANSAAGFHGFFYDIPSRQYTVFDYPSAGKDQSPLHDAPGTFITGISDNTICGYYRNDAGASHGFLRDRKTRVFTPIDHPRAEGTVVTAFSGNMVIGYSTEHDVTYGFIYDLAAGQFTDTLDAPWNSKKTEPAAISGNTIVGTYADGASIHHGFVYDIPSKTFAKIDHPGSLPPPSAPSAGSGVTLVIVGETHVTGISGASILGYYSTPAGQKHGFIATQK